MNDNERTKIVRDAIDDLRYLGRHEPMVEDRAERIAVNLEDALSPPEPPKQQVNATMTTNQMIIRLGIIGIHQRALTKALAGKVDESTLPPEGEIDEALDARLAEECTQGHVDAEAAEQRASDEFCAAEYGKAPPAKPMTGDEKLRVTRQRILDAYSALAPIARIDDASPITTQRQNALVVHACDALLRAREFLTLAAKG